jgi:hypothetical protein
MHAETAQTLFYLMTHITVNSECFACLQAASWLLLFWFAVCWEPPILAKYIAVNIRVYSVFLKIILGMVFLGQQTPVTSNMGITNRSFVGYES